MHAGKYNRGAGLIEIIIGTAIIALSLIGIIAAFQLYLKAGFANTERVQATYLAEEGLEVLRFLRDSDWTAFALLEDGTTRAFEFSTTTSTWAATTTLLLIDNTLTRSFLLEKVYRDTSDSIVASTSPGAILDPNTLKAVVNVEWGESNARSLSTYFSNIFE